MPNKALWQCNGDKKFWDWAADLSTYAYGVSNHYIGTIPTYP